MNDDTLIGVASAVQKGVTSYVVDMMVEMEKQYSLDDNNVLESFPPLSTSVTTTAGNAPELKDNIMVAMPKTSREGHYTCNIRVEYEWKPPRCTSCKVFGHILKEFPKNTGAGETKTMKKPSQLLEVVAAGTPILAAKPTYIPVAKPKILNITAAPAVSTRKRKRIVIRDPEEELPSDTPTETSKVKDKIKAPKPMRKKDQIEMDIESLIT
nr:hypothetical protein [Tanacetum cinerariifolium]